MEDTVYPSDPYYLSYYANKSKYKTKVTLAGRSVNNYMEIHVFERIYKKVLKNKNYNKKKIIIAGLTYKPNVADLRNSLSINIFKRLKRKLSNIAAYDPTIETQLAKRLGIEINFQKIRKADIFIFLVKHDEFKNIYKYAKKNNKIILDPFF